MMSISRIVARSFTLLTLITIGFCGCASPQDNQPNYSNAVRAVSPNATKTVILSNEEVTEFVKNYTTFSSAPYWEKSDRYYMSGVTLQWEADTPAPTYEIKLSLFEDLSSAQTFTTTETSLHIDDLYVASTYYWNITAQYENEALTSKVYSFTTAATPRTLNIEGVSNTRDLGAVKIGGGKQLKQGMIYRSAALDNITEDGKLAALELYKIKTDLDLRYEKEIPTPSVSPLGENVRYYQYDGCQYAHTVSDGRQVGISGAEMQQTLADTIRLFADESNYPIVFHCAIGRDRTGTLAAILLGLLGAERDAIVMDYEMSFFSNTGCTGNPNIHGQLVSGINSVYEYLNTFDIGDDFSNCCKNFLLHIGITAEEIAAIRSIMLV